jgi:phosphoglycerol transferase MdoB-like AlkP superfamily enzyme
MISFLLILAFFFWSRQVLALCLTGTNTFSALLARDGVSIPAFQTLFTYALLNVGYTGYTLYRYGFGKWARLVLKDGWKCQFFSPLSPILSPLLLISFGLFLKLW